MLNNDSEMTKPNFSCAVITSLYLPFNLVPYSAVT
jgi:hypothetical protein